MRIRGYVVVQLHWLCAVFAAIATLTAFGLYWLGATKPDGPHEVLLAPAELFTWILFTGDNASSLLQVYVLGLPFGLLFNGIVGWVFGFMIRLIIGGTKHQSK